MSVLPPALQSPTVPPPVLEVLNTLNAKGFRTYLVGGCVRDLLRGKQPKDFDLCTAALPAEVQKVFAKVIPTGIEHGTVTVMRQGIAVEVTTFRSEGDYVDGRRPSSVTFHTEVTADLSRRDFTINAMAFDLKELVDPFEGQKDLAGRIIRCVGTAMARFSEDGLRALRAVRFATVLDFEIEPQTFAAIAPTLPIFRKVAMERVREEFQKLLLAPACARGLQLLKDSGLLAEFLPEADSAFFSVIPSLPVDLEVRFAVLLSRVPNALAAATRLKPPTKLAERVAQLIKFRPPAVDASDRAFREWVRDLGPSPESIAQALSVAGALGHDASALEARAEKVRLDPLTPKQLALNGAEIMAALGVSPGPLVGQATRFLMNSVLDDPAKNTPEALRELLQKMPR